MVKPVTRSKKRGSTSPLRRKSRSGGASLDAFLNEKARLVESFVSKTLPEARSPEAFSGLLRGLYASAEAAADALVETLPRKKPIACGPGCGICCRVRAELTALEAFSLLRSFLLDERYAGDQALRDRVFAAAKAAAGLSDEERIARDLPCPFLFEGSCMVHPYRPFVCRSWLSFDRGDCVNALRREGATIPYDHIHKGLMDSIEAGFVAGAVKAGFAPTVVGLAEATVYVLERPDAPARLLTEGVLEPHPIFSPPRETGR